MRFVGKVRAGSISIDVQLVAKSLAVAESVIEITRNKGLDHGRSRLSNPELNRRITKVPSTRLICHLL